jgi:hypothetical protein
VIAVSSSVLQDVYKRGRSTHNNLQHHEQR